MSTNTKTSAQAYIMSQLERLSAPPVPASTVPKNDEEMVDFIYSALMSKKFRKFSVPDINKTTIRSEVAARVKNDEPILIFFPFGGYKLWRFEESPEADWGDLFAAMYYAKWLMPICRAYKPGVRFVFRLDEVVVKKLNNVPESETIQYRKSLEKIISFLQRYIPANMTFAIFSERERYENYEQFERELDEGIRNLREERERNPHPLSEAEIASIDLNVRLLPGQDDNPHWREENDLIHIAYYNLQENKTHEKKHYTQEGIVAFPVMFNTPNIIAVGTTKTSIARFWVGVGALQKRGDSFIETVLSPSQLEKADATWEPVDIKGLEGKNFKRVRVV